MQAISGAGLYDSIANVKSDDADAVAQVTMDCFRSIVINQRMPSIAFAGPETNAKFDDADAVAEVPLQGLCSYMTAIYSFYIAISPLFTGLR